MIISVSVSVPVLELYHFKLLVILASVNWFSNSEFFKLNTFVTRLILTKVSYVN